MSTNRIKIVGQTTINCPLSNEHKLIGVNN